MASGFRTLSGAAPKIIAHRGASGYLPEHTLEAYRKAIEMGADFIEPDLVFTKDGYLVARHDGYFSHSTDVAERPEYKTRKRYSRYFKREDWFAADFTLKEIKTLRARQAFPGRSKKHDGKFEIPTFEEVLKLAKKHSQGVRKIGVYPETKHPRYYERKGYSFDAPLLEALKKHGFGPGKNPVYIQSFEPRNLIRLSRKTNIPLIFLLKKNFKGTFLFGLMASYVTGIGPAKSLLFKEGKPTGFLEKAHAKGLEVHPWTFRDDQVGQGFQTPEAELKAYFGLGVDALFTDFPDTATKTRKKFRPGK